MEAEPTEEQMRVQFRLKHVLYAIAMLGASLGVFGAVGLVVGLVILWVWLWIWQAAKQPGKQPSARSEPAPRGSANGTNGAHRSRIAPAESVLVAAIAVALLVLGLLGAGRWIPAYESDVLTGLLQIDDRTSSDVRGDRGPEQRGRPFLIAPYVNFLRLAVFVALAFYPTVWLKEAPPQKPQP